MGTTTCIKKKTVPDNAFGLKEKYMMTSYDF
jgi:hypothetical protein